MFLSSSSISAIRPFVSHGCTLVAAAVGLAEVAVAVRVAPGLVAAVVVRPVTALGRVTGARPATVLVVLGTGFTAVLAPAVVAGTEGESLDLTFLPAGLGSSSAFLLSPEGAGTADAWDGAKEGREAAGGLMPPGGRKPERFVVSPRAFIF
eukprot:comp21294_c0_seq1/m.29088 comp21294_c0_seq1/g.29088  ORF comp21294_c0_seq1/g.29088 comp21294_c0_seq1/m.29088 type:complete len:151 (+) comp21294_c0_seq1:1726-2178(+)